MRSGGAACVPLQLGRDRAGLLWIGGLQRLPVGCVILLAHLTAPLVRCAQRSRRPLQHGCPSSSVPGRGHPGRAVEPVEQPVDPLIELPCDGSVGLHGQPQRIGDVLVERVPRETGGPSLRDASAIRSCRMSGPAPGVTARQRSQQADEFLQGEGARRRFRIVCEPLPDAPPPWPRRGRPRPAGSRVRRRARCAAMSDPRSAAAITEPSEGRAPSTADRAG